MRIGIAMIRRQQFALQTVEVMTRVNWVCLSSKGVQGTLYLRDSAKENDSEGRNHAWCV